MKSGIFIFLLLIMILFTGCTQKKEKDISPLLGYEWYTPIDEVKTTMGKYIIMAERTSDTGGIPQTLLDYSRAELFDFSCDLTLCFTSDGLVGFNYHDLQKTDYAVWFETLENKYGVPTESGNGMASWYENPVGKNTAMYLFRLEEGVQISFYVTAGTPDQSYTGQNQQEIAVPTPELRTPIVHTGTESAVTETSAITETVTETSSDADSYPETRYVRTAERGTETLLFEEESGETMPEEETEVIQEPSYTGTSAVSEAGTSVSVSATSTTTVTTATSTAVSGKNTDSASGRITETQTQTETVPVQYQLQFYESPAVSRQKMSSYTQLYEYRTEEPGQPWELIMEYENVPLYETRCDAVLCFTSMGLVGINYFDADVSAYQDWISALSGIYGTPSETQMDYAAWNTDPMGSGTMIYVFALEDGVQISFFADDTGSELS